MKYRILPAPSVLDTLRSNLGSAYALGDALYVSTPRGVLQFTDRDFDAMTDEEIDAFLTVQFSR